MVYINEEYKFIFIENPKSGSTSILKALEKSLNIKIIRDKPITAHLTCDQIKNKVNPNQWNTYTKVSTRRDPFQRFCSSINYTGHQQNNYKNYDQLEEHIKKNECVFCKKQDLFIKDCDIVIDMLNMQRDYDIFCQKVGIKSSKIVKENSNQKNKFEVITKDQSKQLFNKYFL